MRVGASFGKRVRNVQVLDPIPGTVWNRILKAAMKLLGVNVEEVEFSAGNLKSASGKSVAVETGHWVENTALLAADRIIATSPFLSDLNTAWGRDTIRLHLARSIWEPMLSAGLRVFVSSALARDAGVEKAILFVARPHDFDPIFLTSLCSNLELRFRRPGFSLIRSGRLYLVLWLLRSHVNSLKWRMKARIQSILSRRGGRGIEYNGLNSVLLMQESEVSLDRSYRTQPHWFFEDAGSLPFQTYIFQTGSMTVEPIDKGRLKEQGIQLVSGEDLALTRRSRASIPIQGRLSRDLRRCISKSLFERSDPRSAATTRLSRLFFTANRMTDFCLQANIKAFMTSENYYTEADAMNLVAPALGIHTMSYQISNKDLVGPFLLTNSDTMFTFSSLYHDLWINDGIRPGSFVDIGYTYDSSFQLVRDRSNDHRLRLQEAGANFVICFFDENSTVRKYVLTTPTEHILELRKLMQMVLDDPSVGLVVKSKQLATSPRFLDGISTIRDSVAATGRYIELIYGTRRNIVFPAEAAQCADVTIGHAAGATAVLEGVLTGSRGILLNPYGLTGANDRLYAQADIVFPSMTDALEAIRDFRAGVPERRDLGDWSPIIDQFDPFRDGRAGHRMRAAIEQVTTGASGPNPTLELQVQGKQRI